MKQLRSLVLFLALLTTAFVLHAQETPPSDDTPYTTDIVVATDSGNYYESVSGNTGEPYVNWEPADTHPLVPDVPNTHVRPIQQTHGTWSSYIVGLIFFSLMMIGIIWSIMVLRRKKIKLTPGALFSDDARVKLEVIATLSTISEIVGLAIIATGRHMDFFNAFTRYFFWGVIELIFTFMFMRIGEGLINSLVLGTLFRKPLNNKHPNLGDWIGRSVKAILFFVLVVIILVPAFLLLIWPTLVIFYLYIESIGQLALDYNPPAHMYDLNGALDVSAPGAIEFMANAPRVELAAVGLILLNPILNIIQLLLVFWEHGPKYYQEMCEGLVTGTTSGTIPPTHSYTVADVIKEYVDIIGAPVTIAHVTDNFNAVLGKAPTDYTGASKTHPAITSKAKTVSDVENDIVNGLLGVADPSKSKLKGIAGYKYLKQREVEMNTHGGVKGLIDKASDDLIAAEANRRSETDATKHRALDKAVTDAKKVLDTLKIEQSKLPTDISNARVALKTLAKSFQLDYM